MQTKEYRLTNEYEVDMGLAGYHKSQRQKPFSFHRAQIEEDHSDAEYTPPCYIYEKKTL